MVSNMASIMALVVIPFWHILVAARRSEFAKAVRQ
jgi:hypothetical protein